MPPLESRFCCGQPDDDSGVCFIHLGSVDRAIGVLDNMGKFGKQLIESMQQAAKHAAGKKARVSGVKSSDAAKKRSLGKATRPKAIWGPDRKV